MYELKVGAIHELPLLLICIGSIGVDRICTQQHKLSIALQHLGDIHSKT
jgi:hypothetical protein